MPFENVPNDTKRHCLIVSQCKRTGKCFRPFVFLVGYIIKAINVNIASKNINPKIALNTHQVTRTNRSKNTPNMTIKRIKLKISIKAPPNLIK